MIRHYNERSKADSLLLNREGEGGHDNLSCLRVYDRFLRKEAFCDKERCGLIFQTIQTQIAGVGVQFHQKGRGTKAPPTLSPL